MPTSVRHQSIELVSPVVNYKLQQVETTGIYRLSGIYGSKPAQNSIRLEQIILTLHGLPIVPANLTFMSFIPYYKAMIVT